MMAITIIINAIIMMAITIIHQMGRSKFDGIHRHHPSPYISIWPIIFRFFKKYALNKIYALPTWFKQQSLKEQQLMFMVFFQNKPSILLKSPLFEGFIYIDGDGEIIRNLMVHHPIPSYFKMWWPSKLFTKNRWPSMMDHHWWTIIVMSGHNMIMSSTIYGTEYWIGHYGNLILWYSFHGNILMLKSIKWLDVQLSHICYGQLISKNLCI